LIVLKEVIALCKNIIAGHEPLCQVLEEESIYWNDELEFIVGIIIKTIKKFKPEEGENASLMPLYKNEEDKECKGENGAEQVMPLLRCRGNRGKDIRPHPGQHQEAPEQEYQPGHSEKDHDCSHEPVANEPRHIEPPDLTAALSTHVFRDGIEYDHKPDKAKSSQLLLSPPSYSVTGLRMNRSMTRPSAPRRT
ncbi:MAG: hypothetical protein P8Z31_09330, partial [Gammaproteobacteria bacterium]